MINNDVMQTVKVVALLLLVVIVGVFCLQVFKATKDGLDKDTADGITFGILIVSVIVARFIWTVGDNKSAQKNKEPKRNKDPDEE